LPRVLARCCGYRSVLAKTDMELPDLPRRVFGFDEVIVAPTNSELLVRLQSQLSAWGALEGKVPVMVYFYAGDAHAPFTPDRIPAAERGFSEDTREIFLALHRRADAVARDLAVFWPPPRSSPAAPWMPENGFCIYFGDHGELLEPGSGPHGNTLHPDVTQVLVAVEGRSFTHLSASDSAQPQEPAATIVAEGGPSKPPPSLRRLADVFSTVTDCLQLEARGTLHIGRSFMQPVGHSEVTSFSFYRPAERLAVHVQAMQAHLPQTSPSTHVIEFERIGNRWVPTSAAATDSSTEVAEVLTAALKAALADRDRTNALMTRSNVHAAWLLATAKRVLQHAKEVVGRSWAKSLPALHHSGAEL